MNSMAVFFLILFFFFSIYYNNLYGLNHFGLRILQIVDLFQSFGGELLFESLNYDFRFSIILLEGFRAYYYSAENRKSIMVFKPPLPPA